MHKATTSHEGADISSLMDVDRPYLPGMEPYMRAHIARVLNDARSAGPSAVPTPSSKKTNRKSKEAKNNA